MTKFAIVFFVCIPLITWSQDEQSNQTYRYCSEIYFGSYNPKRATSLSDLPDSISEKLVYHLTTRLGDSLYSKIKISGGQIVDLDRLYREYKYARKYKWTPYSYYLCFSFQDAAKGIGLYTAKIVLDKFGNVIEEIELPSVKNHPEKIRILSLYEAANIAKSHDFESTAMNTELKYDKGTDSLTWCVRKIVKDNGLTFGVETLIINAHTGEKIKINYGGGIR